ncbi:hypothetical protein IB223_14460 [Pseudoxanthomonas sp. PXM03]|uniref:hypothetical protein n=1 Tax=Pseudoxanthomonas sp. PXM03 TaxID=2769284 RepID=UPI001782030F|nr:hypothetical protein [Pseudoxanthomonas sp. PXM03]MBD9437303.1 hypothetical protein [Pseudoxanthomonas sp. PXM03]
MDPIDCGAPLPWHGPSGTNGGVGPRDPLREMRQNAGDFRAWVEEADDASREGQTPLPQTLATVVGATQGAVSATLFDDTQFVGTVYPWMLQAQAYLSQLGVREASGGRAAAMDVRVTQQASSPYADAEVTAMPAGGSSRIASTDSRFPLATGIAATVRSVHGTLSGFGAPPADAAGSAFAASWSERLLRRTVDADGNTTWWLRDYGMDAAAQEDLTRSLLSQPLHQRPHRIVINGVEVWRAPHSLPES